MRYLLVLLMLTAAGQVLAENPGNARYFWVVRDGLTSRESIDALIQRAVDAGANGLIVQVVGRGEAYYRSSLLPPADHEPGFDPLAYTIARARPMGLEVHAWINAFLVWSSPSPPSDSSHVWHTHPEWFMADRFGRSTREYTQQQCESSGLVGATLSPALPEVRKFVASIASEIATNYDVDGIHLDYIRYPNSSFGFEDEAVGAFYLETGLDPLEIFRRQEGTEEVSEEWAEWRRKMVTLTVETVRSVLRADAPGVLLSCAVMADPVDARENYSCDWVSWLQSGLVDFVCPMAYTTSSSRAEELAGAVTEIQPEKIVYGIGVYNQSVESAFRGARIALQRGAAGVCAFSLNSIDSDEAMELRDLWGDSGSPVHRMDPAMFQRVSSGFGDE